MVGPNLRSAAAVDARGKRSNARRATKMDTATNAVAPTKPAAPAKPPLDKAGDKSPSAKSYQKKAASDKRGAGTTPRKRTTTSKKSPAKKPRHSKTNSVERALNHQFRFNTIITTALRKMGLHEANVHRMASLPVYDTVMNKVVPFMSKRKRGGSTAGVDGEVILASDGVNVGASFTTPLIYRDKVVKHIFAKDKQVAVKCPLGCNHSFVLPLSLFAKVCTNTRQNIGISQNAHKLFLDSTFWMKTDSDGKKFQLPSSYCTVLSKSVYSHWTRMGHALDLLPLVASRYSITLKNKADRNKRATERQNALAEEEAEETAAGAPYENSDSSNSDE